MVITVGCDCIDRNNSLFGYTFVDETLPADADGTIDYVCIYWGDDPSDVDVASFIHEGSNALSTHATALLADKGAGQQEYNAGVDFTAFAIDTGEYIGAIGKTAGKIDYESGNGQGMWFLLGDQIPCESVTFNFQGLYTVSIKGTGTEAAAGWTGKVLGVDSPAKVLGVSNPAKVIGV
jgi:hypothetical protein